MIAEKFEETLDQLIFIVHRLSVIVRRLDENLLQQLTAVFCLLKCEFVAVEMITKSEQC